MKPACHNRAPRANGRVVHGIDGQTGARTSAYLPNDWFTDRCATWDGVGIGQPTAEYPNGTPYPIAHGWVDACRSCRWLPKEFAHVV